MAKATNELLVLICAPINACDLAVINVNSENHSSIWLAMPAAATVTDIVKVGLSAPENAIHNGCHRFSTSESRRVDRFHFDKRLPLLSPCPQIASDTQLLLRNILAFKRQPELTGLEELVVSRLD